MSQLLDTDIQTGIAATRLDGNHGRAGVADCHYYLLPERFLLACKVCCIISDILTLVVNNAKPAKLDHDARFRVAGRLLVVPKRPTSPRKQECG